MAARKIDSSISAVLLHAELYLYFAVKESGMNKPAEKGLVGGVKRMTKKGGELIAEFLVKEKIPYVFGICGHGNVGLLDPLYEVRDKVKLVSPRHEQTAGHMADGYFRVKHKPVATLTSTGPGSANLIMALAVAQTDSSALLAITANVPTSQFNRGPFRSQAGGDAHLHGPRLGESHHGARRRANGFLGAARDYRERADLAVQPGTLPGTEPPQPGGFSERHPAGGQAEFPAHSRRHAAARSAAGDHHGHQRPSGPGQPRRSVQSVPGGGRGRPRAGLERFWRTPQRSVAR